MFALLSPRLWAAIVFAGILAASHFGAYRSGKATVRAEWDRDIAERTAQALEAEKAARAKEQAWNAAIADARGKYAKQVQATGVVVAATAIGMRELERQLNLAAVAGAASPHIPGIDGADPRPAIVGECARQLSALDEAYRKLADKARALQAESGIVRVKP